MQAQTGQENLPETNGNCPDSLSDIPKKLHPFIYIHIQLTQDVI